MPLCKEGFRGIYLFVGLAIDTWISKLPEVGHHLLGKQAQGRLYFTISEAAGVHVTEKVGNVLGLQLPDSSSDLLRAADGAGSLLSPAVILCRALEGAFPPRKVLG